MANEITLHRDGNGIYVTPGYVIVRDDFGYGTEWALFRGDVSGYFGGHAEWVNTFPRRRDAVDAISVDREQVAAGDPDFEVS